MLRYLTFAIVLLGMPAPQVEAGLPQSATSESSLAPPPPIASPPRRMGFVGLSVTDMTHDYAKAMNTDNASGAIVVTMVKDGPAERAGVQIGDIVRTFDGTPVGNAVELMKRIRQYPSDQHLLGVERDHSAINISVTTTYFPQPSAGPSTPPPHPDFAPDKTGAIELLGLFLKPIDANARKRYRLDAADSGLVISAVDPASDAGKKGLLPGDIVSRADNHLLTEPDDFRRIIDAFRTEKRGSVLVFVSRGGLNVPIPLSLSD